MKINLAVSLDLQGFSGSGVTDYNAGITNGIINTVNGKTIVTQRPSIDISEDASGLGLNDRARGIYYWETNNKLYIFHDNDVYATTQDSVAVGAITAGTERLTILETIGTNRLVILDAENDEGWVMSTGETVTAIASNFPSTLVHGGAILDTFLFVMDEDGVIYNSEVNDPTTFLATSFINSERDNDKGVYLGKHHEHLVSFGTRKMEFFYDAGNASGSPLNRRQDISYNIGLVSGLSVWENGDITYFLGSNPAGQISLYKLENFQPTVISSEALSSYFTQGLTQTGINVLLNGFTFMSHDVIIINIYTLTGASPGQVVPKESFCIDTRTKQEGFISTNVNSHVYFPLMAWTKRTGGQNATTAARTGEGIFYNGDILNINDNIIPVDTLLGSDGVYAEGVYEVDIYTSISESAGENIPLIVRTGLFDGETSGYKFQSRETIEAESTLTSQILTITHSDEVSNSFNTGNTVDLVDDRKEVHECSRFMKRNYQLDFSGNEQVYLESIDVEVEAGL
jgi:hypothetical protein